jgi:hypothetical protein
MKAGATTALGIRGAKTCNRAGNQRCREKVFHVFSLR